MSTRPGLDELFDAAWNRRDANVLPELEDWLDRSVMGEDPDAIARACLATARLYVMNREYALAGDLVDRGIAAGSHHELTTLRLLNLRAYCFLELGSIAEAVEPLLVVERTAGEHIAEARQAQVNLALALLDLGDVAGAREGFERLRSAPDAREWDVAFAVYGLGRCHVRAERWDDVEAALAELRALNVTDRRLRAHEDLLEAWIADGRRRPEGVHAPAIRAMAALDAEAGVEPLECLVMRARALRRSGDPTAGRVFLAEALSRAPAGRHRAPVLREVALTEAALGDVAASQRSWSDAYDELARAEAGSAGRALRAASERARVDLARVRELQLSAAHDALQRAYRSVEERVADRTRDLAAEVAERREAEGRALAASRAKTEFLAGMSHELRTPLNAILGYTELLLEDGTLHSHASDLGAVHASARHLLSLVDDVLDLQRVESGRIAVVPEDVDVHALLGDLAARMQLPNLAIGVDPAVHTFRTDPTRVAQIVQNLVSNGARHARTEVRVAVTLRGTVLCVLVEDDGMGMAPEVVAQAFEPFVQGPGGGRAGLGLALVRHLCEALGGTIDLDSAPGKGTRARVALHALR